MGDSDVLDLRSLDRDVARAVGQVEEWRSGLNDDPGTRSQEDPFDGVRRVSAKSTRDALLAYEPSDSERLLRDSLLRWTAALVQTRIGLADDVAFALEANAPRGRFEGEETKLVSWREAWRRLVAARTVAETRLWLDAAGDAAPSIAALNRTRASRRLEVARRLGAPHPWALLLSALRLRATITAKALADIIHILRAISARAAHALVMAARAELRSAGPRVVEFARTRWSPFGGDRRRGMPFGRSLVAGLLFTSGFWFGLVVGLTVMIR